MAEIIIHDYRWSPIYRFCRGAAWLGLKLLYRMRTTGLENIPDDGPVIIGSNHIHNFDPLVIGVHCPRYIHFMAKEELFKLPIASTLLKHIGAFPVRRGRGDKAAIRHALAVTAADQVLVVFPEGHRSRDGQIGKGQSGIALIARKANCPVVPAVITGPYGFRKTIRLRFGRPILPKPDDTNETFVETLMEHLRELQREGTF